MSPKIIFNGISLKRGKDDVDTILTITIPKGALTFLHFSILIRLLNHISRWKFSVVQHEEYIELISGCKDDCPKLECSIEEEQEDRDMYEVLSYEFLSLTGAVQFSKLEMRSLYYYELEDFRQKLSIEIGLTPELLEQVEAMVNGIYNSSSILI